MKRVVLKLVLAAMAVACGHSLAEKDAKADGFYYYGGPAYYVPAPVYYYPPVYAAPAPVVSYGYVAGPPVVNMGAMYPAYYYPESFGWYAPYYPTEVKYKYRHGTWKVEIDD